MHYTLEGKRRMSTRERHIKLMSTKLNTKVNTKRVSTRKGSWRRSRTRFMVTRKVTVKPARRRRRRRRRNMARDTSTVTIAAAVATAIKCYNDLFHGRWRILESCDLQRLMFNNVSRIRFVEEYYYVLPQLYLDVKQYVWV